MDPHDTQTLEAAAASSPAARSGTPQAVLVSLSAPCGTRPGRVRAVPPAGLELGRPLPLFDGLAGGDARMSRLHARLKRARGGWTLTDCDSRNGTFVEGRQVLDPVALRSGDVIRMGDTVVVFGLVPSGVPTRAHLGMRGISEATTTARDGLVAVARHDRTVLLLGETGTGKEVAARALHTASARSGRFVAVNCASLSGELLESTLFGHRKGAFTGASEARAGLVRSADGGTLFLDEVGELDSGLQARLLRMLETRTVRPVGAAREVPVDLRVVSATHHDLVAAVAAGRFRADLYARLAQWVVPLAPLRDRRTDLPILVDALLASLDAPDRVLSAPLAEAWALHSWPLNVRGLRNALATATIVDPTGPLQLSRPVRDALDADRALFRGPGATPPPPSAPAGAPARPSGELPSLATLEAALQAHQGKVAATARALGLSRQQVYRLVQSHHIELARFRPGAPGSPRGPS